MDKELKQKWIDALRSDAYEQIVGCMRTPTQAGHVGHCCLDVLICVSGKYRPPQMADSGRDLDYAFVETLIGSTNRHFLQDMNDLGRKTFREIADHIERTL